MKFIGFYTYTVVLTYISLVSSLVGMVFASRGSLLGAVICLIISGFCDMFDGIVARTKKNRTDDEKNFGIQLDSLCDVICFGVFPAVILYFQGVQSVLGIAILIFYALCGLIRLAFFNVLEIKRQKEESGNLKHFRGMPITFAAAIYPGFFLICSFLPAGVAHIAYHVAPLIMGFLFIWDVKIPKLDVAKLLKISK